MENSKIRKLVIAGSRTLNPCRSFIMGCFNQFGLSWVDEVFTGCAYGVDKCVRESFTGDEKRKVKVFSADWLTYGNAAGPIRNKQMAQEGDALLLIWNGDSKGSKNMKETMLNFGKPVFEIIINKVSGVIDEHMGN